MNLLVKPVQVVGHILNMFLGCCFSTPIEITLKEHPYLRFHV